MQMIHLLQGTSWGSIVESSVIGSYYLSYLLCSLQIGRHCSFPCLLMPMGVGFLTGFFCCYCSWKPWDTVMMSDYIYLLKLKCILIKKRRKVNQNTAIFLKGQALTWVNVNKSSVCTYKSCFPDFAELNLSCMTGYFSLSLLNV